MATDLPWFPMYPADFLVSTATLTPTQGWAYTQLLMYAWTNGGVPDDREACSALTRCVLTEADWQAIRSRLQPMATPMGLLSHPRMERERTDAQRKHNNAVEAGRRGAQARWRDPNRVANGNPNGEANGDANGNPNSETVAITVTTTDTQSPPKAPPQAGGLSRLRRRRDVVKALQDPNWIPF